MSRSDASSFRFSRPARSLRSFGALAALLLAVAFSGYPAQAEVVARVNGAEVSGDEIRAYVDTLGAQEKAALSKDAALLTQVVRAYLARHVVLKEAQAKKWDQQPAIKTQLERVREQALIELYLQAVSRPPDSFPSNAEVQTAYEGNKSAFEVPRQFRVAQVFVAAAGKENDEKARRKVDEVTRKLKQKGADFAAIARADSEDPQSAPQGGEIGWLSEGQMVAGIRSTVTGLAKDAVSEPVRLDDGWHVMKLLDSKPASIRPLAEVRDAIVAQLRADRTQANRQAYLAKLLEQHPPTINELALPGVLTKTK